MRKLLILTVVLLTTGTATAQASTNDLGTIIKWEKNQIKVQREIIRDKLVWRTLTKYTAVGVPVAVVQLQAHRIYLHKLIVRLAANVKEYKAQHVTTYHGSPRLSAWVCIHNYEGAWNANTGNGYYGGLQEDLGFQSTYGSELLRKKGTADHWTPQEQIMVADRAFEGYNGHAARGFWPWPNTARTCGLL